MLEEGDLILRPMITAELAVCLCQDRLLGHSDPPCRGKSEEPFELTGSEKVTFC